MPQTTHTLIYETLIEDNLIVDLTNIPQSYKDLQIVQDFYHYPLPTVTFNNDSSDNYQRNSLLATSSGFIFENSLVNNVKNVSTTAEREYTFSKTEVMDYSSSTKQKSVLVTATAAYDNLGFISTRYMSTAAITSIQFTYFDTRGTQAFLRIYGIVG